MNLLLKQWESLSETWNSLAPYESMTVVQGVRDTRSSLSDKTEIPFPLVFRGRESKGARGEECDDDIGSTESVCWRVTNVLYGTRAKGSGKMVPRFVVQKNRPAGQFAVENDCDVGKGFLAVPGR